jgi:hypothetical protein
VQATVRGLSRGSAWLFTGPSFIIFQVLRAHFRAGLELVGAHVVVVVGATSVRDGNLLVLVGRIELAVVLVAPLVLVVG